MTILNINYRVVVVFLFTQNENNDVMHLIEQVKTACD